MKKKKNNLIIKISILVILIILILLLLKGNTDKPVKHIPDIDTNSKIIDLSSEKNDNNQKPNVSIYGIKQLKISEYSKEVVFNYINPEQNIDKYYIQVSLILSETGEELFASDLIPPGMGLDIIQINRGLARGTYNAILHVQPYTFNDFSATNNADLEIEIIVE